MPCTAAKVLEIIDSEGHATQSDIRNKTSIPPRTVKYAIKLLREGGMIKEIPDWKDMRKRIYVVQHHRQTA
ncbi:MAG: winged helix-turn-helix domain-containing protein [Candidatus Methanosuratus sp.]|nr:winged helix-turn-helix domain-containing protein [Candidatus Methanosuratincola sp.]